MNYRALTLLALMSLTNVSAEIDLSHFKKEGEAFHREIAGKVGAPVDRTPESLKTILERIRNLVLSDRVGFIVNIGAQLEGDQLVLTGESERPEFKATVVGVFRELGFKSIVDRIEIVPDLQAAPAPFAVVVKPYVLTWSKPELKGIAMDESLLGEPVYIFKELADVYLIKNFSGYWGYAAKDTLRRITKAEWIRFANEPKALLLADHKEGDTFAPAGCRLLIKEWGTGETCVLLDPANREITVSKKLCQRSERDQDIARAMEQARSYLTRPYNLGGRNSVTGIDCSGLVQMAYRTVGLNLARDAKQQYLAGNLILPCVPEALLPGDAIFFMNKTTGQVDHTGLYLGDRKFIHASGPKVRIQSMDPAAPDYYKRFDHDFIGAKRYWR